LASGPALPRQKKREVEGWGPWSTKEGVIYAHAPTQALEQVIALRLHLDESNSDNGPLKIVPGTHNQGVLTDEQIHGLSEKIPAVECHLGRGGVLAMRPLVIHASSKSVSSEPRRVLHIEYASSLFFEDEMELAIA
jgi:ectoine hydroxylase-related dioxygenase (phytanoyl-CoA dioxygenase family)